MDASSPVRSVESSSIQAAHNTDTNIILQPPDAHSPLLQADTPSHSHNDSHVPLPVPQDQKSVEFSEAKQLDDKSVIMQDKNLQGPEGVLGLDSDKQSEPQRLDANSVAKDPSHWMAGMKLPGQGNNNDKGGSELDKNVEQAPEVLTQKPVANDHAGHDFQLTAEQEAMNRLRRQMEIERKEVDKWKKEQQQDIAEERRKIQEAQHSLLEEKIR